MSPAAPEAEKPKKPAASKSPDRVTPMMAQFLEIKAAHADALLFYRMGDFYELFFDDAVAAAAALDITLTHRGTHLGQAVPMCGVPYHASEGYLQRLIRAGFRVAICEQTEDPAAAKKRGAKSVVRREVVRLVTAGTLSEETLLDAKTDNFIAAIACLGNVAADAGHSKTSGQWAVAWADMSTGGFFAAKTNRADLSALLARLAPREIIIPDAVAHAFSDASVDSLVVNALITASINASANPPMLSPVGDLASPAAADAMRARFGVACHDALTAEGVAEGAAVTLACAHILAYFEATQYDTQITLSAPRLESDAQIMALDAATRSNLELNCTLSGGREGSLLAAIDESVTAAGARLLAARLNAPLTERAMIEARLKAVGVFVADADLGADIRAHLKTTPDMARALNRLAMQRGGPRDVAAIAQGLGAARSVAARLLAASVETSHGAAGELATQIETLGHESQKLADMGAHLSAALDDSLPLLARDGGFIRSGFHANLDEARALRDESRRIIAALQNRYGEETGIKALKIKHNGVL